MCEALSGNEKGKHVCFQAEKETRAVTAMDGVSPPCYCAPMCNGGGGETHVGVAYFIEGLWDTPSSAWYIAAHQLLM